MVEKDYGSEEYWEKRYQKANDLFDWYFDWNSFVRRNLDLDIKAPVLVIGCGNSEWSHDMEKSGIEPVVSMDISRTCCRKMAERFGGCYVPMDVCNMTFRDGVFPCVIDKGTLDALVCRKGYEVCVTKMMHEIARVLAVNGIFIEVTFGPTGDRMGVYDCPDILPWTLEQTVYVEAKCGTVHVVIFRKFEEYVSHGPIKPIFLYGEDEMLAAAKEREEENTSVEQVS